VKALSAIVAAAALAGTLAGTPASAALLTFTYSGVDTGATPGSPAPWLTATFDDSPASGVRLTLTASLEVSTEFISTIKFNLNPSLDAALMSYTGANGAGVAAPSLTAVTDGITGQGLIFDFSFGFQTAQGDGRFAGTDVFEMLLLHNNGGTVLSVSDFDFLSGAQGENTRRYSLAHVQGIAEAPGSGWIFGDPRTPPTGVPEPGTLALLGIAVIGFVAASRRRTRG